MKQDHLKTGGSGGAGSRRKKLRRTEIIWLVAVTVFYLLYNLPGVPRYGDAPGMMLHAVLTIIPVWVAVYIGLIRVNRLEALRDDQSEADRTSEEPARDVTGEGR